MKVEATRADVLLSVSLLLSWTDSFLDAETRSLKMQCKNINNAGCFVIYQKKVVDAEIFTLVKKHAVSDKAFMPGESWVWFGKKIKVVNCWPVLICFVIFTQSSKSKLTPNQGECASSTRMLLKTAGKLRSLVPKRTKTTPDQSK